MATNDMKIAITAIDKASSILKGIGSEGDDALGKIEKRADSLSGASQKCLYGFERVGEGLKALGLAYGVGQLAEMARGWGQAGVSAQNAAASIGMSAAKLREYQTAATLAGGSAEGMTGALLGFNSAVRAAAIGDPAMISTMQKFGIQLKLTKDGAVDTVSMIDDVADAMSHQEKAATQNAIASAFGLSSIQMMLRNGAKSWHDWLNEANRLAAVSEDTQKSSEQLGLSLNRLGAAFTGVGIEAESKWGSRIKPWIEDTTNWIAANKGLTYSIGEFGVALAATAILARRHPIIATGIAIAEIATKIADNWSGIEKMVKYDLDQIDAYLKDSLVYKVWTGLASVNSSLGNMEAASPGSAFMEQLRKLWTGGGQEPTTPQGQAPAGPAPESWWHRNVGRFFEEEPKKPAEAAPTPAPGPAPARSPAPRPWGNWRPQEMAPLGAVDQNGIPLENRAAAPPRSPPQALSPSGSQAAPVQSGMITSQPVTETGSQPFVDKVKQWEEGGQPKLTAYDDKTGHWTVGYGHTGRDINQGTTITAEQAEAYLKQDLAKARSVVDSRVKVPVTEHQREAMTSFSFNVGTGGFSSSTALKRLNQGDYEGAEDAFKWWNKATSHGQRQTWPGLVRRRADEEQWWNTPDAAAGTDATPRAAPMPDINVHIHNAPPGVTASVTQGRNRPVPPAPPRIGTSFDWLPAT